MDIIVNHAIKKNQPSFEKFLRPSKHSETLLINQLSQMRAENQEKVFKFGFGQSPFPVPKAISQALADAAHRKEYMSVQGHLPLRQAICELHSQKENKSWDPERVIVGAGSKILLYCVMAAFEQAEVLLPAPSWVSYEPQGKLANHQVNWIGTEFEQGWRLTPEALDSYCQSRSHPEIPLILVFNYPSNPTGQSYSRARLQSLAEVMRRHNIIVIADEIYSLLSFSDSHSTIEDFYPEGCIVSSGLSKWCGAGGWRLGFVHIPKIMGEALFQGVIGVASETYSCAPSPIQVAATEAYQNEPLASVFLNKQKQLLDEISHYCGKNLRLAGVKVHNAEGGFYLFPDFSNFQQALEDKGIHTSEQLTNAIMEETGVALLPGSAFGMPPSSLTARLAFVDFDGGQIWDESQQSADFDKVKQGIQALCQWLENI